MGSEPCVYDSSDDDEDTVLMVNASEFPSSHKMNKVPLDSSDEECVLLDNAPEFPRSHKRNEVPLDSSDEECVLLDNAPEFPRSHKRNKVPLDSSDEDTDVDVIGKVHYPETRTMGKSSVMNSTSLLSGTKKFPARNAGDDDCCILDHDPEKSLLALDSKTNDTDDLVVTGESGPVACRDYPHARHLCAKFPFKSTAHESFCEQCHCYVCDTLAPCLFWFLGKESSDHCHAYDKDEKWKVLRKCLKPGSLPLPVAVSHTVSSRHGRSKSHSVSYSQQPLPGMVIPSSGISSPTCNIYSDPNLFFGVSSNFLYTSETNSLPIYLRPCAPSTTNVTRGIDAYSDSMVFSTMVPVTVDSSSARTRNSNRAVPANRSRVIKQHYSNFAHQNTWATVTSGAERRGLNLPVPLLPNVADEHGLLNPATPQSCNRDVTVENNTQIYLNRQGNFQQQMHLMRRGHTRMSELTAPVSRDSIERLVQLNHRGPFQSVPTMHKDRSFGQRDMVHTLQDDIVVAGSWHWEHENAIQTSENTAVVPSQMVASQTACNENLRGHEFNETQRKGNAGQNVRISSMMNIPGANQVSIENSQQEIVTQQIPIGQEVDVSPTLDDILAQLDCSDLWADLDLLPY